MSEREIAARAAGLKDLVLLKLHPDDMPLELVMADLRKRFGHSEIAFDVVDARKMSNDEYAAAQGRYLATVEREGYLRREQAATDAAYARFK